MSHQALEEMQKNHPSSSDQTDKPSSSSSDQTNIQSSSSFNIHFVRNSLPANLVCKPSMMSVNLAKYLRNQSLDMAMEIRMECSHSEPVTVTVLRNPATFCTDYGIKINFSQKDRTLSLNNIVFYEFCDFMVNKLSQFRHRDARYFNFNHNISLAIQREFLPLQSCGIVQVERQDCPMSTIFFHENDFHALESLFYHLFTISFAWRWSHQLLFQEPHNRGLHSITIETMLAKWLFDRYPVEKQELITILGTNSQRGFRKVIDGLVYKARGETLQIVKWLDPLGRVFPIIQLQNHQSLGKIIPRAAQIYEFYVRALAAKLMDKSCSFPFPRTAEEQKQTMRTLDFINLYYNCQLLVPIQDFIINH